MVAGICGVTGMLYSGERRVGGLSVKPGCQASWYVSGDAPGGSQSGAGIVVGCRALTATCWRCLSDVVVVMSVVWLLSCVVFLLGGARTSIPGAVTVACVISILSVCDASTPQSYRRHLV